MVVLSKVHSVKILARTHAHIDICLVADFAQSRVGAKVAFVQLK